MNSKKNWFESHLKTTITIFVIIISLVTFGVVELTLSKLFGLGNPVLYDSSPIYGFRPMPNQRLQRFLGAELAFNNLGLRSTGDWDKEKKNKILFLGDSVTYGGSYISNEDLFSHLVFQDRKDYVSGNAGVNTWGVENIHALVVEEEFLPADYYITALIEDNFYRGLVRLQGLPYYNTEPSSAWAELFHYFAYTQNNKRYFPWQSLATEEHIAKVLSKSVLKLKSMDVFLKAKGYKHKIFILPTRNQVVKKTSKDSKIQNLISENKLDVVYLLDELQEVEGQNLFHDEVHVTKEGHKVYAQILSRKLKGFLPDK